MFTIVWLPVPTAMVGSMAEDGPQKAVYIGTLMVSSAVMVVINLVLLRTPDLWVPDYPPSQGDLTAAIVLTLLFGVALVLALVVPGAGYYPDVRPVPDRSPPGSAVPSAETRRESAARRWLSRLARRPALDGIPVGWSGPHGQSCD